MERSLSITEAISIKPFSLVLPWAFNGTMDLEIVIKDQSLYGREDGFLRLDLYPRVRPVVHEHHCGSKAFLTPQEDTKQSHELLDAVN
jgi:hypothetical protein